MLKLIIAILIYSASANIFAGIFSPSNYDDCILDGIKTAKTDLAIGAVYRACRSKFPEDKSSIPKNGICKIYWDGWKLVVGSKYKVSGYTTYDMDKDNIYKFQISIPTQMEEGFRSSPAGFNQSLYSFAGSQWDQIQRLCK